MQALDVEKKIRKLKHAICINIAKGKYDNALNMISICANILYQTNICYTDPQLENDISEVAKGLSLGNKVVPIIDDNKLLFYDGFGLNDRGLAQIYINALCKVKKVIYVTYLDRKDKISDIIKILDDYSCDIFYISRKHFSPIAQIRQLEEIICNTNPGHMFFYSIPNDVVATPIMFAYQSAIKRYQINLTDHAFWLGSRCIDKCIEFRNYGAEISNQYRNIPKEKIVIIPFYPIIHYDKNFQGFPFPVKPEQKVFFSGGALYKTFGNQNRYYKIVDHILSTYKNTIFWYAGYGDDTMLKKILYKYPNRAYFTAERSDLYQILEKCQFYLSTYPICGGLMFQYAAMAGIVPVTLKSGNISDGFLINQSKQGIEFLDTDALYAEVDRLMTDTAYVRERGEQMKKAVIAPEVFEEELKKLVTGDISYKFDVTYEHIDTAMFRQSYLDRMTSWDVNEMLVRSGCVRCAMRHYPISFLGGALHRIKRSLIKRLL